MNKIKNLVLSIGLATLVGGSLLAIAAPQNTFAAKAPLTATSDPAECSQRFLTFPTWFRGLVEVKEVTTSSSTTWECVIQEPTDLSAFIWHIVLNVLEIALQLVAYIAVGFILFGGFQFLNSAGAPDVAAKARMTIINAAIGLAISIGAIAATNVITGLLIYNP